MAHNERRTSWWKDGVFGLTTGALYGATSVAVGHPWDTIKTKMQAQRGYEDARMFPTFLRTLREQGPLGLYRGCVPALCGSAMFRSAQFAGYESAYTHMNGPLGTYVLPLTGGVQVRVIVGGMCAGLARGLIETPMEYIKVNRQTQQGWLARELFKGCGVTCCRSVGLLTVFFVSLDSGRRHVPGAFTVPVVGPFFSGGLAGVMAWLAVWPLEYMKSQVQGHYGPEVSVATRMRKVWGERGFFGLYRGVVPGLTRSFVATGCSMIVIQHAHRKLTEWGLRGEDEEEEEEEV